MKLKIYVRENEVEVITPEEPDYKADLACSFCGNTAAESFKLIAGPGVFICDSCVSLCEEIIEEAREEILREVETEILAEQED